MPWILGLMPMTQSHTLVSSWYSCLSYDLTFWIVFDLDSSVFLGLFLHWRTCLDILKFRAWKHTFTCVLVLMFLSWKLCASFYCLQRLEFVYAWSCREQSWVLTMAHLESFKMGGLWTHNFIFQMHVIYLVPRQGFVIWWGISFG